MRLNAANRGYLIHSKLQKYLQAMSLYTKRLASNGGITDPDEQEKILREQLSVGAVRGANGTFVAVTFPAQRKPAPIFTVTKSDIDNVRLEYTDPLQIASQQHFAQVSPELPMSSLALSWQVFCSSCSSVA